MFHKSITGLIALSLAAAVAAHPSAGTAITIKPTGTGVGKPTSSQAPYPITNGSIPLPPGSGTGYPTGTGSFTTYTYLTTETLVITSCPPQVTNCPATSKPVISETTYTVTTTVPPKTKIAPTVTQTSKTSLPAVSTGASAFGGFPGGCPMAQTVTHVVTVTACGPGCVPVPGSTLVSGSMDSASKPSTPTSSSVSAVPVTTGKPSASFISSSPESTLTAPPVVVTQSKSSHGLSSSFIFTNSSGPASTSPYGSGTAPGTSPGTVPITKTKPVGTAPAPTTAPCTTITQVITKPIATITLGLGTTTTPCTTITETLTIPLTTVTQVLNGTTSTSTTWTTPIGTGVSSAPSGTIVPGSTATSNRTVASTLPRLRRVRA